MARKSLSSQVIEEVDRARGLLRPVQDIVDPMTSHMVGAVLESLHRVETMCIAASQRDVDAIVGRNRSTVQLDPSVVKVKAPARGAASHKASRGRKEGS